MWWVRPGADGRRVNSRPGVEGWGWRCEGATTLKVRLRVVSSVPDCVCRVSSLRPDRLVCGPCPVRAGTCGVCNGCPPAFFLSCMCGRVGNVVLTSSPVPLQVRFSSAACRRGDWSGRFAISPVGAHRHTPPGPTVCHTAGVCCGYPSGHLWSVAWGWWCVRQVSCGVHGGVFRFAGKPSSTHLSTDAGCGGFACRTRRRRQARGVRLGVVCRSWLSDEAGALACRQAHGTQSTASHLPPDPLT